MTPRIARLCRVSLLVAILATLVWPTTVRTAAAAPRISPQFQSFYDANGGLPIFGLPISDEFVADGLHVQYFERARFEYHPEFKGTVYETELGLLGRQVLVKRGWYPG